MVTPPLEELLPPLKNMPWMTVRRRIENAKKAREELRASGFGLGVFPDGKSLYLVRTRGFRPGPREEQLVRSHYNALLALLCRPRECEAARRWRRPRVTRPMPRFPRGG